MIPPFHGASLAHNLECKRMSNLKLAGKVSIMTGTGQGNGLATAQKLTREGSTVVCGDFRLTLVDDATASDGAVAKVSCGMTV